MTDADLPAPEAIQDALKACAAYHVPTHRLAVLHALSAALEVEKASHTATITDWQADHARAEAAEAERDALKAELAEAVEVLTLSEKHWDIGGAKAPIGMIHEIVRKRRAFLARHQKGADT